MYFNRDLSWLLFNYRVLQEAASEEVPLLERIRFLSIFSSNLDEFFRVRYPSILAISQLNPKTRKKINAADENLVERVQDMVSEHLNEFGEILTHRILPKLEEKGFKLYYNDAVNEQHLPEIRALFLSQILGYLQPVLLNNDNKQKFQPENNQLYLTVSLQKPGSEEVCHAVINIPSTILPRFFCLSPVNDKKYLIFIDDIIRENIDCVFPGFDIKGIYSIKFNRDAEMNLEDEYAGSIIKKIEKQLQKRDYGPPSRFLYESGMPMNVKMFLTSLFDIQHTETFVGGRYHNLKDLAKIPVDNSVGIYPSQKTLASGAIMKNCGDIFNEMDKKDILLHFPYQSYDTILSFFNQAAIDPDVQEVYITLYRIAANSHIANALISAAKNGKKVTAFVEIKARFDEANNIFWSKKMKEAGIIIIYSIPEIKVHSKIALIVSQKGGEKKYYSILSTGNFNEQTARFYTDHAILTANNKINKDLMTLFSFLKERANPIYNSKLHFSKILVSQFNMMDKFQELIEKEIAKVKKDRKGLIRVKVNNLEEPHMINLLYNASQKGVEIQMLVRSICCLIPQKPDLSDNIEIRRIVDRYLEHTRLFMFGEDKDAQVIMGSSDWMIRNLHHRIEVCAPVLDKDCKAELLRYFNIQWQDNTKAARLTPDMNQVALHRGGGAPHNAQNEIYGYLKEKYEDN